VSHLESIEMSKNNSNYRFKPGNNYQAEYSFPSRMTSAGDIIERGTLTTEFEGKKIVQHGLKNVIRHHAKRLGVPEGYSCVVSDDD
jgi:hypothetical protein